MESIMTEQQHEDTNIEEQVIDESQTDLTAEPETDDDQDADESEDDEHDGDALLVEEQDVDETEIEEQDDDELEDDEHVVDLMLLPDEPGVEEADASDEQTDLLNSGEDFQPSVESVVEAVLFASDEPLTAARLADIVETNTKQIRQHVKSLNEKYQAHNNAFRIEQIAGGFQMLTLSPYNNWLRKMLRARSDSKLSPAALETLAIIAYKQPVIRADIEAIRGVAAGEVIRNLMYKGLVKIVGRAEVIGRPMLYGTTKKFLEVFGLNALKDLPKIEELKKPPT